jgi:hypothetical protein
MTIRTLPTRTTGRIDRRGRAGGVGPRVRRLERARRARRAARRPPLRHALPRVLLLRTLPIRSAIGMEAAVLLLWSALVGAEAGRGALHRAGGHAVGIRREDGALAKVVAVRARAAGPAALAAGGRRVLREGAHGLPLLLRVVHHLVIGPLGELGVGGGVVVRVLARDLALGRRHVHRIRLLRILVELGVEGLGRGGRRPPGLLLVLDRVRVRLLGLGLARGGRRRREVVVGWRRSLPGDGGIGAAG